MSRRRRRVVHVPTSEDPRSALLRRVARYRRRGEHRRAFVALRLAAHADERDAKMWMLYGAQCLRSGKDDAAREAFRHAAWVHDQNRHPAKARVARELAERVGAARAA